MVISRIIAIKLSVKVGRIEMIIIVFGLAASGKTYIGNILEKDFDFHHEDADQWLTNEMQQYVHHKKLFTLEMLDDFTRIIIKNIEFIQKKHSNVVISQGLYRKKNREDIERHFSEQKIMFLQIEADDEVIHQRLLKRGDWISSDYASSMRQYFEPMNGARIIYNNQTEEEILSQLLIIKEINKI